MILAARIERVQQIRHAGYIVFNGPRRTLCPAMAPTGSRTGMAIGWVSAQRCALDGEKRRQAGKGKGSSDSRAQVIQRKEMAQPIAGKAGQETARGPQRLRDARWRRT